MPYSWGSVSKRYTALASIGEVLLVLWLAMTGVDEERWLEQANADLLDTARKK
jgi:hypothetical protein